MRKGNRKKQAGFTMVEMIVSFALLAIFLAAASMCISHAFLFFFDEKQTMSSYTVADIVMSELKTQIRTMQGSKQGEKVANGYLKLRSEDGATVKTKNAEGVYTGTTLEFVVSNISDAVTAVQIDTRGCGDTVEVGSGAGVGSGSAAANTVMIRQGSGSNSYVVKQMKQKNKDAEGGGTIADNEEYALKANCLTLRYYSKFPGEKNERKDRFMDRILADSAAVEKNPELMVYAGKDVVWHAEERLPEEFYQGYSIDLEFSVVPVADVDGNQVVNYVDATVFVKDGDEVVCQKERRINLQNTVYFKMDPTMYSDD